MLLRMSLEKGPLAHTVLADTAILVKELRTLEPLVILYLTENVLSIFQDGEAEA